LNVAPFAGGTETPLPVSGSLLGWSTGTDSVMIALGEKTAAGVQFTPVDLRTGARRAPFTVPDSAIADWDALPDDGWAWIPPGGRSIRIERHGEAAPTSLPVSDWYIGATGVDAAADGLALAFLGYDAATFDSLGLSVMSLPDGKVTRWAAIFGENAGVRVLPDHSILLRIWDTQESVTLYRLRGPGQVERLGTIPRAVTSFSVSDDLRRATVVTHEYSGDAWLHRVVRP
jgi:dipeptidyl aminopeptidase/acylaminoacyl peptidase